MFLQCDGLANGGLQIGRTTSGHEGLELPHSLLQGANVAFYFIANASNDAGEDSIVGVGAEKGDDLLFAYLDKGEFLGLGFQGSKAHLDTRGDITSNKLIVSIDEIVRNGRASIDYQQVFVGRQSIGSDSSCQTILSERLRRGVLVLKRNRRVVVEQDEVLAQTIERVDYRGVDVDDRGDDTIGDGIERAYFLYLGRIKTLVDEVVHHLAIVGKDGQLGAAVSLVNTQIHGGNG